MSSVFMSSLLLTLAACGGDSSSSNSPSRNQLLVTEGGTYEARLLSLNEHLAGDVHGKLQLKVTGDDMNVQVRVNGAPSGTTHFQSIHMSDSCPTLSMDANNDGIIDGREGAQAFGDIAVPLDMGNKVFPSSDAAGNYKYEQTRSVAKMMGDLKLKSGFGFQGKQVVVYGVPESVTLPDSVSGNFGLSKHAAIPIACGTIIKISDGSHHDGGKY